ncbi:sugar kinase [Rubrimonas sp.]|uniref:sugar kinase n=1 Tax=Rubrimonas sp. TaxID=2036015 RepID=UPI002FDCB8C7
MADRFLAIGECMVEMSPRPGGLYALGFAGDTLNTAWYARRLLPPDWSVGYLTAIGADALSDRMEAFLRESGLDATHVARRADRTVGAYLIELREGERSFVYWRGQSAARTLADDPAALEAALSGARLIYFSGITLAILDPDARARLLAAVSAERGRGAAVAFDPNIRPRLWENAATMRAAIMAGAAVADIALPSFEDEAAHFADASPEATADRYAAAGARVVIVKNGAGETLGRDETGEARLPARPAKRVVDTTAAGDSFNAGALAALTTGYDLRAAMEKGAALARRVIGAPGALVEPERS